MLAFKDFEATQYAMDRILEMDQSLSREVLPGKEYIDELDNTTPFQDGIKKRIVELGYADDLYDTSKILDFLIAQCKKTGIMSLSRTTLRNWLTSAPPNSAGRENVYQLCFALEMNAEQTAEFFLKAYLNRPFNYKNTYEAVCFHCLLTEKTYTDVLRIIASVESIPVTDAVDMTIATDQIGAEISMLPDETELIRYLSAHRYKKNEQHQTAVNKINELLQSCYALASKETTYTREKPIEVTSIDALLDVIYDYDAYAMEKVNRTIAKSKLPKTVKVNLPDRERLDKILRHDTKSDDVYRKALVLLLFYHFYASAYLAQRMHRAESDIDLRGYENDFEIELDEALLACGYVRHYKRNPFDWLMLYCASFPNPLSQFRSVIYEYYLKDELDDEEQ